MMGARRSPWMRAVEVVGALVLAGIVAGFLLTRHSSAGHGHQAATTVPHAVSGSSTASGSGSGGSGSGGSGSSTASGSGSGGSGSGGSGSSTASGSGSGGSGSGGSGSSTASGSGSGGSKGSKASAQTSKYLEQLQQKATSATGATFKATYRVKGSTLSIVFAQEGSKSSFSSGTSAYYSDGQTRTECDTSNGTPSCYTGAKPLTGLLSLISPTESVQRDPDRLPGGGTGQSLERDPQWAAFVVHLVHRRWPRREVLRRR